MRYKYHVFSDLSTLRKKTNAQSIFTSLVVAYGQSHAKQVCRAELL